MRTKKGRIGLGILWALLTLPAGFFAMVTYGLARLDTGWVRPEPQLVVLWVLPFVLLVSAAAEIIAGFGGNTPAKAATAKIFAMLPLGTLLVLGVLLLIR